MKIENILNPSDFDELICKDVIFPKDCVINKMIENNDLFSILFFGNPGVGKSLSIKYILKKMGKDFFYFNSTTNKKNDLDNFFEKVNENHNIKQIIVIEEIHRLNKDKQDLLLMYLEKKLIVVFATTTENPFFKVNPALRSRMFLYRIENIDPQTLSLEIFKFLENKNIKLSKRIIDIIVDLSKSDFRQINFYLEIILNYYQNYDDEFLIKEILKIHSSNLDRKQTNTYDIVSAFHKSIRGSDPDAALYYLAELIRNGDLSTIYRRLYAVAYEDIGLANPNIGTRVHAAIQASEFLGLPEAKIPLSNIVVDMCLSPKSNSTYNAILEAEKTVNQGFYPPPHHIRDNHYKSAIKLGVKDYLLPHNYKYNFVQQNYLPKNLKNKKFYKYNKFSKNEVMLNEYWEKIKNNI